MVQLHVSLGCAARIALCEAFDSARTEIDAEFYSLSDPDVIASLNAAAARDVTVNVHVEGNPSRFGRKPDTGEKSERVRGWSNVESLRARLADSVHLTVENDPNVLMHAKAAVVDGAIALISTANPTACGFDSPGEVLVSDTCASDVNAVAASIAGDMAETGDSIVAGPASCMRLRIGELMHGTADLRVATEDLSDPEVVKDLVERSAAGHHDRVLIEANGRISRTQRQALAGLRSAHVDVRTLPSGYMHEKYVDCGDQIYVGSANLTHNGLDEAREIGVVAQAGAFGPGATALRADFDGMWSRAVPA